MSKSVNIAGIEDGTISYLDAKYLADRGKWPRGVAMPDPPEVDDSPKPAKPSKVTPLAEQSVPVIERNGGIVDDDEELDEESYTTGWNNDQRRAELSKRKLSVEGNKDDMIARLRRSDSDTLIEGDESDLDD